MRNCIRKNDDKGFTLVELLVVIIIIGILAAVAIPAFLNQRQRANDATVQSDLKNISLTVETMLISKPTGPIVSSSDKAAVVSGSLREPITTSPGVSWNIYGSANGYCITGWHENGKIATEDNPLTFDPSTGGLKKEGEECGQLPAAPNGSTIVVGGTPAPIYAWLGTVNNSPSTATDADGNVRTNMATNPSLESNGLDWPLFALNGGRDNAWSSNGLWSMKTIPRNGTDSFVSPGGDQGALRLGMQPGRTYTASVTMHMDNPQTGPWHSTAFRQRNIVVFYLNNEGFVQRPAQSAQNIPGDHKLKVTFTIPSNATQAFIRLYNGSSNPNDVVWWDEFMLEEGNGGDTYFDGSIS